MGASGVECNCKARFQAPQCARQTTHAAPKLLQVALRKPLGIASGYWQFLTHSVVEIKTAICPRNRLILCYIFRNYPGFTGCFSVSASEHLGDA
jgi:hypothetical protein